MHGWINKYALIGYFLVTIERCSCRNQSNFSTSEIDHAKEYSIYQTEYSFHDTSGHTGTKINENSMTGVWSQDECGRSRVGASWNIWDGCAIFLSNIFEQRMKRNAKGACRSGQANLIGISLEAFSFHRGLMEQR